MQYKILSIYMLTTFLLASCSKEKYIEEYGAKVPPGIIPYSLGQIVQFENGLNDTISLRCTRYQNMETVVQSPCSNYDDHCTKNYHYYKLVVDLETLDKSRIFNLEGYASGILIRYTNNTNNFKDWDSGNFSLPIAPDSVWSDSTKLNNKTFYKVQEKTHVGYTLVNPAYSCTLNYGKYNGICMFESKNNSSGSTISETWVLVK